jgi:ABC-type Zn uptake system ZnuABC Zn-binding protein ZnuA
MIKNLFALVAAAGVLATACAAPAAPKADGVLQVVATHSILGDLVRNVGGDRIALLVLVGAGGDAHTFEPTPQDVAQIAKAELLFENGLEFEGWLDDAFAAADSKALRVAVSEGIELLAVAEEGEGHADEAVDDHAAEDGDHHGEVDPHIWQSVSNWILAAKNVRNALVQADPANAAAYEANAAAYIAELEKLDVEIFTQANALPAIRRVLFTSHDALGYFAARYGFEVAGAALASFSTEAADPSAAEVAELVQAIKAAGVPAVFTENTHNSQLLGQIALEAGIRLAPELYTDALGEPGSAGETYLKLMRSNIAAITGALSE